MRIRWRVDARAQFLPAAQRRYVSQLRVCAYLQESCAKRMRREQVGDTEQDEARKREKIQQQLDQALADSFPASDPVSIVTSNEEEDWGTEPREPASKQRGT
jgi:hypothetical protein